MQEQAAVGPVEGPSERTVRTSPRPRMDESPSERGTKGSELGEDEGGCSPFRSAREGRSAARRTWQTRVCTQEFMDLSLLDIVL